MVLTKLNLTKWSIKKEVLANHTGNIINQLQPISFPQNPEWSVLFFNVSLAETEI